MQQKFVLERENFTSIKSALATAKNGDRITIKNGHYSEGEIVIDKEIEIIGENYPKLTVKGSGNRLQSKQIM